MPSASNPKGERAVENLQAQENRNDENMPLTMMRRKDNRNKSTSTNVDIVTTGNRDCVEPLAKAGAAFNPCGLIRRTHTPSSLRSDLRAG